MNRSALTIAGRSEFFRTPVGLSTDPLHVPAEDYLVDDRRYSYEGNWVFARFDNEEVPAARFGFGRGGINLSDYGGAAAPDPQFLWLHLELMTRRGALLWLATGRYQAGQVQLSRDPMARSSRPGTYLPRICLPGVFEITGWPTMRWRMQTDDRVAGLNLRLRLRHFTVLPDHVMPVNLFAMWVCDAQISGVVRFDGRQHHVTGVAFYDHPRINARRHHMPPFGWFLYCPVWFEDGSTLVAYHTRHADDREVSHNCFGLYHDSAGQAHWLDRSELSNLEFDADDKPSRWTLACVGGDLTVTFDAAVTAAPILRAWGGPTVPQTRRDNGNVPLVFDARAVIKGQTRRGQGLAEYVAARGPVPTTGPGIQR